MIGNRLKKTSKGISGKILKDMFEKKIKKDYTKKRSENKAERILEINIKK